MRNLTITLDEETARWARIQAATRDQSLSKFVGDLLREQRQASEGYDAAMDDYLSRQAKPLKRSGGYPDREELHDRAGLR